MKFLYWSSYLVFWGLWGFFTFQLDGLFFSAFESEWVGGILFVIYSVIISLGGWAIHALLFPKMMNDDGTLPGWGWFRIRNRS